MLEEFEEGVRNWLNNKDDIVVTGFLFLLSTDRKSFGKVRDIVEQRYLDIDTIASIRLKNLFYDFNKVMSNWDQDSINEDIERLVLTRIEMSCISIFVSRDKGFTTDCRMFDAMFNNWLISEEVIRNPYDHPVIGIFEDNGWSM